MFFVEAYPYKQIHLPLGLPTPCVEISQLDRLCLFVIYFSISIRNTGTEEAHNRRLHRARGPAHDSAMCRHGPVCFKWAGVTAHGKGALRTSLEHLLCSLHQDLSQISECDISSHLSRAHLSLWIGRCPWGVGGPLVWLQWWLWPFRIPSQKGHGRCAWGLGVQWHCFS